MVILKNNNFNSRLFPLNVIIILAFAFAILTANPLLTTVAILSLFIIAKLLWKQGQPPILFAAILIQWLQVTAKLFYANWRNLHFQEVFDNPKNIESAYMLALISLITISLGIYITTKKFKESEISSLNPLLDDVNLNKIRNLYILSIFLTPLIVAFSFTIGGLQQFIIKLLDFKWALFFVFSLTTFHKKDKVGLFIGIIIIEVLLGFTGYFSSFKDIFLFCAIIYVYHQRKISIKKIVIGSVAVYMLFNLMVIWTVVKTDYRLFLSGGETKQVVTVSNEEALSKLYKLSNNITFEEYQSGVEKFFDRISYIDFFSAAIENVPQYVPYENGKLWTNALTKVVTPRFFFPEKEFIDDSEKTRLYTGQTFAGAEEGTSISIGYVTESYVDFGEYFMFIPLFFYGLAIGWIYKYIIVNSKNALWAYAFAMPLFHQIYLYEKALDKVIGALIAYFIVFLIFNKLLSFFGKRRLL
jgi:hypothetical protein